MKEKTERVRRWVPATVRGGMSYYITPSQGSPQRLLHSIKLFSKSIKKRAPQAASHSVR